MFFTFTSNWKCIYIALYTTKKVQKYNIAYYCKSNQIKDFFCRLANSGSQT